MSHHEAPGEFINPDEDDKLEQYAEDLFAEGGGSFAEDVIEAPTLNELAAIHDEGDDIDVNTTNPIAEQVQLFQQPVTETIAVECWSQQEVASWLVKQGLDNIKGTILSPPY